MSFRLCPECGAERTDPVRCFECGCIEPRDEPEWFAQKMRDVQASQRGRFVLTDTERAGLRWLLHLPLPVKNEQERQHSIAAMTAIARLIGEGRGAMSNDTAKPGHLFVCCACGKVSTTRYGFETANPLVTPKGTATPGWDESCMLNAVEFAEERLVWNESRTRVIATKDQTP